ncbi:UNVERIFIED_CONTAM: hypothetical protein GTU68_007788 [Idotea baltica]|nr:hypothetical protein [Idotea baltica]
MVVVAIIGMLAAIIAPKVINRASDGTSAKVSTDVASIMSSVKLYRLDNLTYPSSTDGLQALKTKPAEANRWKGPYIEILPKDPWGHDYLYANPGTHSTEVDIYSLGADNKKGGSGVNADVGNWDLQ